MTYDPIAHMNRWRDIHRANGTSGGKGNVKKTDYRHLGDYCPMRDAVHRMRLATSDAIEQFRFDVFLAPEFLPFDGQWVQL